MALTEKKEIVVNRGKCFNASIAAPPSKAYTLRALFIAALAEGKSTLRNALFGDDQMHAARALNELGISVKQAGSSWVVDGGLSKMRAPRKALFLGNSGVSVRFLLSIAALPKSGKITITGDERMQQRPSKELLDALSKLGVEAKSLKAKGCPPIEVKCGTFKGGTASISGEMSSQYFSSILISAPYARENVTLVTRDALRSKPYVDITIDCMNAFGVKAENRNYESFTVKAGQKYSARDYAIEGDYSNAAYFLAAAAITKSKVKVSNINPKSAQGDRMFAELLKQMGCKVKWGKDNVVLEGAPLNPIRVDMGDYPDLVPPLAIVASFANGKSEFTNIAHLRYKESDRLEAVASQLRKCGVVAHETLDSLVVEGTEEHRAAEIETFNDHRIAMSFSVMGLAVPGMRILNPKAVVKSFPDFYERMEELAGRGVFS